MVRANPKRAAILELSSAGHSACDIVRLLKVPRQTVPSAIKRGTLLDRVGAGRPVTVSTPAPENILRKRIARSPARSMGRMAKGMNVSEGTVRKVVKRMLNMHPCKLQKRHGLNYAQKKARVKKCGRLQDCAANGEHLRMLFMTEKLFTVEQSYNSQNVRVFARTSDAAKEAERTVSRSVRTASVMVWAGMSATGRTPLIFVEKGAKINTVFYLEEVLKKELLPWSREHFKVFKVGTQV
ncbi:hypothetical protein Y032_0001g309 [Ancylostoma ceylanicum]|uniref:Uncharacterized protein n=1 Tax=Ancylostoma ceylanicum TaxID=53326 RepID=A0A016W5D3_9BILA|nr:hypothetical protein Y032_0001g309 [Ancylostoma ceylanicum]